MQKLTLEENNIITWEKPEPDGYSIRKYRITGYEIVDEITVHLELLGLVSGKTIIVCFLGQETEINEVLCNTSQEIINNLNLQ